MVKDGLMGEGKRGGRRGSPRKKATHWLRFTAVLGGALVAACFACTKDLSRKDATTPPKDSVILAQPREAENAQSRSQAPEEDYAEAVRKRDFEAALRLLDRSTKEEQKAPEVRYLRGRIALALGDVEGALRAVDRLEEEWPSFADEARDVRFSAAKLSQDVTLLTLFLSGKKNLADQLLLAEAQEKSGSSIEARKLAESVLADLKSSKQTGPKTLEAQARTVLARSLVTAEKPLLAAKEYRWLATEGAGLEGTETALTQMRTLDPTQKLSPDERLKRAETFSEQGKVEETEREIAALRAETQGSPPEGKLESVLAWAIYISRTDYERASALFGQAAARGGPDKKRLLYYEAKALARSNRDSEAIAKYEALARLGGSYAEHASYQTARLTFIDGKFKQAVTRYQQYLKGYGKKGVHSKEVEDELPVARLAAEDFAAAHVEFKELIRKNDNPRERARLMELSAVALLGMKKNAEAARAFREVIHYRPLSFPALLAAARLRQMNEAAEPLLPPATVSSKSEAPLNLSLPDKVWRLSRVGLDEEAEAALHHQEPSIKRQYGSRSGEALCRLYGQLQTAKRRYQIAQTAASWSVLSVDLHPESEWQWDCIYPTPYETGLKKVAEEYNVSTSFVYSIMRQESAFRPSVVSPAGAVGLMQIIPPTAKRIAEELRTTYSPDFMVAPAINVRFGTYYLRRLLDMFGGRLELAAASYNAGPHAVTRWLRQGESLPLDVFVARIPYTETRNYVYLVMGNYARYSYRKDPALVPTLDLALPQGLRAKEDAY